MASSNCSFAVHSMSIANTHTQHVLHDHARPRFCRLLLQSFCSSCHVASCHGPACAPFEVSVPSLTGPCAPLFCCFSSRERPPVPPFQCIGAPSNFFSLLDGSLWRVGVLSACAKRLLKCAKWLSKRHRGCKKGHRGLHRGAGAIESGAGLRPGLPLDSLDIRPAGVS